MSDDLKLIRERNETRRKLRDAATTGPWARSNWRICAGVETNRIRVVVDFAHNAATRSAENEANAEFVTAARNDTAAEDIDALVALLDSCRAEIRCLYSQLTGKRPEEATGGVRKVLDKIDEVYPR